MSRTHHNQKGTMHLGIESAPDRAESFRSHDQLCIMAVRMFEARRRVVASQEAGPGPGEDYKELSRYAAAWTRYWHASISATGTTLRLCQIFHQQRFNRLEKEIVTVLILVQLGLSDYKEITVQSMIRVLCPPAEKIITALRTLSEESNLLRSGLVIYRYPDVDLRDRELVVEPSLVEIIILNGGSSPHSLPVRTEVELNRHLSRFVHLAQKRSRDFEYCFNGNADESVFMRKSQIPMERLFDRIEQTLALHPSWRLSRLRADISSRVAWQIFLLLYGKELGFIPHYSELFLGQGLLFAVAEDIPAYEIVSRELLSRSELIAGNFIQPCAGNGRHLNDAPDRLAEVEFGLTAQALERLGMHARCRASKSSRWQVRKAVLGLDRLILPPHIQQSLTMAFAQIRQEKRFLDDWGLREIIPMGRGVTMLFYGLPGTGKTAVAEAIACELDKPLLIVDYSAIQNCYVGMTEKNIVAIFKEARAQDAVLLWDEADAMLGERDQATQSWEIRSVNVLLQEVEQFEGVCILATNRLNALDKALERRISLKLQFPMPTRYMRRQIWQKLVPPTLPLAPDCSFDELSRPELSGGEIKNAVLNAARLALARDPNGPVLSSDFQTAVALELKGRFQKKNDSPIGFCHDAGNHSLKVVNYE